MDTTNTRAAGRTFNVGDRVALVNDPDCHGTVTLVYPDVAGNRKPGYEIHWDGQAESNDATIYAARSLVPAHRDGGSVDYADLAQRCIDRVYPLGGDLRDVPPEQVMRLAAVYASLAQAQAVDRLTELVQSIEAAER